MNIDLLGRNVFFLLNIFDWGLLFFLCCFALLTSTQAFMVEAATDRKARVETEESKILLHVDKLQNNRSQTTNFITAKFIHDDVTATDYQRCLNSCSSRLTNRRVQKIN